MATIEGTYYYRGTYTLTVTPNNNGGGTVPAAVTKSAQASSETVKMSVTIPATVPERTGYRFLGYATTASGPVAYQPGGTYSHTFTRQRTYDHTTTTTDANGNTIITKYYRCQNQSKSVTLYAIWEATGSTVSTSNGTLGTAQTLTITPLDASYTHDLYYDFAGQQGTIATGVTGAAPTVSWTPDITLANALPSAASGTCTLTCETYDNGTLIGTTTSTITLYVPTTYGSPAVNVNAQIASVTLAEDSPGIAAQFNNLYVQNQSTLEITGTFTEGSGSPAYGATVSAVSISINGQTLTGNGDVTNLLTTAGSNLPYTFTITDSRGRTDTYSGTYDVEAYNAPSVGMTAERDPNDDTQVNVTYTWNISPVGNYNTKQITISYATTSDPDTTTDITITPATYSDEGTPGTYTITGLNAADGYIVKVYADDFFTSVFSGTTLPAVGDRIMHISATDNTIAFHGQNESDGSDHEYYPIEFHDDVQIDTDLNVDGTITGGGIPTGISDLGEVTMISSGTTHAYTIEDSSRHIFFCCGGYSANLCIVLGYCTATGAVVTSKIGSASNITVSSGTNRISIKSDSYTCFVLHLSYTT